MKDRIANPLAVGDKVMVVLPESQIFGFVSQVEEGGMITGVRGVKGGMEQRPGRILVSCVIALPVDGQSDSVAQLVKVYDVNREAREEEAAKVRTN